MDMTALSLRKATKMKSKGAAIVANLPESDTKGRSQTVVFRTQFVPGDAVRVNRSVQSSLIGMIGKVREVQIRWHSDGSVGVDYMIRITTYSGFIKRNMSYHYMNVSGHDLELA